MTIQADYVFLQHPHPQRRCTNRIRHFQFDLSTQWHCLTDKYVQCCWKWHRRHLYLEICASPPPKYHFHLLVRKRQKRNITNLYNFPLLIQLSKFFAFAWVIFFILKKQCKEKQLFFFHAFQIKLHLIEKRTCYFSSLVKTCVPTYLTVYCIVLYVAD